MDAVLSHGGSPNYQKVRGPNPMDPFTWHDDVSDVGAANDTSILGQLDQLWELGIVAHEAALRKTAKIKLQRLSAHDMSFDCPEVSVGRPFLFYELMARKRTPRWRGPVVALDVDDVGVIAKFAGRISKVARHCVRKRVGPASERLDGSEAPPSSVLGESMGAIQLIRVGLLPGARRDMAPRCPRGTGMAALRTPLPRRRPNSFLWACQAGGPDGRPRN